MRAALNPPVEATLCVPGSNISAEATGPDMPSPPATRTLPLLNSVAVCRMRGLVIPAAPPVNVLATGSYISELANGEGEAKDEPPPERRTLPLLRVVAV